MNRNDQLTFVLLKRIVLILGTMLLVMSFVPTGFAAQAVAGGVLETDAFSLTPSLGEISVLLLLGGGMLCVVAAIWGRREK